MFRMFAVMTVMSGSILVQSTAMGHPGHSHVSRGTRDDRRIWTSASGDFRVSGDFVSVKAGLVQIRCADDSLASVRLSELIEADQQWIDARMNEIRRANEDVVRWLSTRASISYSNNDVEIQESDEMDAAIDPVSVLLARLDVEKSVNDDQRIPMMAKAFEAFVNLKSVRTRWDANYFYVESNGVPAHKMMVGITAWQQQVPLPQAYTGENSWRIPLHPVPARKPTSTKDRFLRGAIALAVNGIPIFNPLNNRGEDSYAIGELDEYGGHCGRADDYHYHIAPIHLEKTIGKGLPIAYALDGYPVYGYEEPDGSKVKGLDPFNGHTDAQGNYHYHATKVYPYLNGGFHGEVTERGGQVDPQPRAEPIRPDGRPLRDAKITDFVETKPHNYVLTYDVRGKTGSVSYVVADDGSARFTFVDPSGSTKTESYVPRRRGPGGNERRPPPPPRADGPPPRDEPRPPRKEEPDPQETSRDPSDKSGKPIPSFTVTSPALDSQGNITAEYTCDGASASPAVEWKGFPADTKSFAISLWHVAPDQEKSYWVIYNIPANVSKIGKNVKNVGTTGLNDKRRAAYDPMCSKGPGVKKYHITIYALSAEPKLAANQATRANLLKAIKDITLAEATLDFQYERKN